jgi:hypothetical protein
VATISPISASVPICGFLPDRRVLVPCFSASHAPASQSSRAGAKLASHATWFVTLRFYFGMWWRRTALALNGMAAVSDQNGGAPYPNDPTSTTADLCNNATHVASHEGSENRRTSSSTTIRIFGASVLVAGQIAWTGPISTESGDSKRSSRPLASSFAMSHVGR